ADEQSNVSLGTDAPRAARIAGAVAGVGVLVLSQPGRFSALAASNFASGARHDGGAADTRAGRVDMAAFDAREVRHLCRRSQLERGSRLGRAGGQVSRG